MRLLLMASMLSCLMLGACSSGAKGQELFETAQFEEKQNNRPHAIKLYEEIIAKYPGTELAQKAQERLTVLQQGK
jgi:TolA-binding protein